MKTHFTRKNFIAIATIFFYVLLALFSGLCIDSTNPVLKANNPIQKMGLALGFPANNPGFCGWIFLGCVSLYILIFAAAFIYEMRLAKYYENKIFTKKYSLIYLLTFLIIFGVGIGIALAAQYPYDPSFMFNSFLFVVESLVIGLLIFLILGSIIMFGIMLYVNFKHIDEPFRFFGNKVKNQELDEEAQEEENEQLLEEQGNLSASFGEASGNGNNFNGAIAGGQGGNGEVNLSNETVLKDKERVFPGLCSIDYISMSKVDEEFDDVTDLSYLCTQFRNYLAKNEKLYFNIGTIRAFISGLAASRFIILEGLSGTGKSSLARRFSEFIGEESFFEAVQATWRDRTSILGYYNDFSKTYNETEFLKRLYSSTFKDNHINIMVLDEVNISRVEYYFADFLSILEYPVDKWALKIMQLPYDFDAPEHLQDGILKISPNTWFIGTANKDDSTYTITDKVYDRAITISFDDRNEPFDVLEDVSKLRISFTKLQELFAVATNNTKNRLTARDLEKFSIITNYTYDTFDLTFGNRIMHQIETLVPVYVACGGTKEEALDFMFSKKVLSKLDGRFEDYIKKGLTNLKSLIEKTYGDESFKLSKHTIDKLVRKL